MPGARQAGHELDYRTIAANEEMRRHAPRRDGGEVGVPCRIEGVRKKFDNRIAAELAGRQADGVNHQQVDLRTGRPLIVVRTGDAPTRRYPSYGIRLPPQLAHSFAHGVGSFRPRRSMR